MTNEETYVTNENPTIEDWLDYIKIDGENSTTILTNTPLTDADRHAEELGMTKEELLDNLNERVGSIGAATLQLVHTEFDDSWHITLVDPIE